MSVASYVLKMPIIAVIVGIVGLACISFALYGVLKPSTRLDKVKSLEQPVVSFKPDIEGCVYKYQ